MNVLMVLFFFSVTCWNWHSFCLLKLAKYLLINVKLAVCVLDKPVAQATLLGGTVVSSINSCRFGADLYCLHHLLSPYWWRPPCFASIFQLWWTYFLFYYFEPPHWLGFSSWFKTTHLIICFNIWLLKILKMNCSSLLKMYHIFLE